jgi:lipoprotein-anchoring transpeptidase ErfK/SrfK
MCVIIILGDRMKKKLLLILAFVFLFVLIFFDFYNFKVVLNDDLSVPYKADASVSDFVSSIQNGTINNLNEAVDTSTIGEKEITLNITNKFNEQKTYTFKINVVDKEAPKIKGVVNRISYFGDTIDMVSYLTVTDNSGETIEPQINGDYDFNTPGIYNLTVTATDSAGNVASVPFTLTVKKEYKNSYYIRINRIQNIVRVYGLDGDGNYDVLTKTFLCSTGAATETGIFTTSDKVEWLYLVGGVYGQYTTRIDGAIWFHSVPYTAKSKDSLEWEEFNKLGTKASLGCIRLDVHDVKWIYDNCPKGTKVEIYDDANEVIDKPKQIIISSDSPNKGWDPTDPDENNPWNK